MELHVYFAFVVATIIMISLPGPSVLLTVAHSISFGWKSGVVTVAGATAGIAVQLMVAAIGLASLLNGVAEAFELLRWGGAAYLVYLGIKQWRSAGEMPDLEGINVSRTNLFLQGLVVTTFNPKSLVFIAAFLPQFIDASRPMGVQMAFIVPTFLVITFSVTSIWAVAAGNVRGFFQNQRAIKAMGKSAGGMMIMAGLGLAMARRGN